MARSRKTRHSIWSKAFKAPQKSRWEPLKTGREGLSLANQRLPSVFSPERRVLKAFTPARRATQGRYLGVTNLAGPVVLRPVKVPQIQSICQKRQTRTEVLHALGIAGRKGMGHGHYTELSKVRC